MDEDDLKLVVNEKNIFLLLKQSHEMFSFKTLSFRKLFISSEMRNDDLMHREGLMGYVKIKTTVQNM